jgi:hypothetical protein
MLQSTPQKILKLQLDALTIFTLAAFMNGWKEVKVVQYAARYAEFLLRLHSQFHTENKKRKKILSPEPSCEGTDLWKGCKQA